MEVNPATEFPNSLKYSEPSWGRLVRFYAIFFPIMLNNFCFQNLNHKGFIILVDAKGLAPAAQEYLKKGCPPALRARLWQQILGSTVTKNVRKYSVLYI